MYKVINVEQGSQEWHDLRAKHYKTASRTPSVMNASPFMSREQLAMNLRGEYTPFYSNAMRQGNDLEDMVRLKAESLMGDSFMPMVAVNEGYLASLDGLNFDKDTLIEIKVSEKTFNEIKNCGDIPDHYLIQIHHQMMVIDTVQTGYLVAYNPKTEEIAVSIPITRSEQDYIEMKAAWEKFDDEKDTLKVLEFDLSNDEEFMKEVENFKKSKENADIAKLKLDEAKRRLHSFHKGGKTSGGGVTVSFSKESISLKYADIYKDNKQMLKDIDLTKYKAVKDGSYKVTVR